MPGIPRHRVSSLLFPFLHNTLRHWISGTLFTPVNQACLAAVTQETDDRPAGSQSEQPIAMTIRKQNKMQMSSVALRKFVARRRGLVGKPSLASDTKQTRPLIINYTAGWHEVSTVIDPMIFSQGWRSRVPAQDSPTGIHKITTGLNPFHGHCASRQFLDGYDLRYDRLFVAGRSGRSADSTQIKTQCPHPDAPIAYTPVFQLLQLLQLIHYRHSEKKKAYFMYP